MCKRRTVAEPHQRMHDRGRMHDDLDLVVREPEEEVSFDQLEALVGERCRVDGDLGTHVPRGMCQRGSRRDVLQLVTYPPAERSPGGREHERVHLVERAALKALEGARMLAVNRD